MSAIHTAFMPSTEQPGAARETDCKSLLKYSKHQRGFVVFMGPLWLVLATTMGISAAVIEETGQSSASATLPASQAQAGTQLASASAHPAVSVSDSVPVRPDDHAASKDKPTPTEASDR